MCHVQFGWLALSYMLSWEVSPSPSDSVNGVLRQLCALVMASIDNPRYFSLFRTIPIPRALSSLAPCATTQCCPVLSVDSDAENHSHNNKEEFILYKPELSRTTMQVQPVVTCTTGSLVWSMQYAGFRVCGPEWGCSR